MAILVFDFDDTLIYSRSDRAHRLLEAVRKFGHQVDGAALPRAWGMPFQAMVTTIAPTLAAQFTEFIHFYAEELAKAPPLACPGAVAALPELARHARLIVHSASHSRLVRTDLNSLGLLPLFDFICGSDWQARPKPDPSSLDFLWSLPGLDTARRSDILYIGDSPGDAAIAEHAGIRFIRVRDAEASQAEALTDSYLTINDFSELLELMLRDRGVSGSN